MRLSAAEHEQAIPDPSEGRGFVGAVFLLPRPPSTNALFFNRPKKEQIRAATVPERKNRARGRGITAAYRAWLKEAGQLIQIARQPKIASEYHLIILAERPQKARLDLANLEKAISDLLVKMGIVQDDSLAESITMKWHDGIEGCQVVVTPVRDLRKP